MGIIMSTNTVPRILLAEDDEAMRTYLERALVLLHAVAVKHPHFDHGSEITGFHPQ